MFLIDYNIFGFAELVSLKCSSISFGLRPTKSTTSYDVSSPDNNAMTKKLASIYQDWQKSRQP